MTASDDATTTARPATVPETLVDEGESPALSVVVITKNEADRVRPCIESIFRAAAELVPFEVILVDSASTDGTVDLATDYPITVLEIPEEHVVSCGAGRYVGDRVARGDLVLHVDGDMKLTDSWLPAAVEYLRENDDVAAVEGCLNDRHTVGETVLDVDKVGGVMLFDRDALESVGGFAPYLNAYEDVDVGYRLTAAGHRLVRLPIMSAEHPVLDSIREPVRRWRAGYYHGVGQAIRYGATSPRVLRLLLGRQRYKFALLAWTAIGLVSLGSLAGFLAWVGLSALGFAGLARRRGVSDATQFLLSKALAAVGAAGGLLDPADPPEAYPLEAIEVVAPGRMPAASVRDQLR